MDVLLDEQHRTPGIDGVLAHDRQEPLDDQGRQPQAQLVEQKQPWLAGEGAGDREHLLLAAREQPGPPPAQVAKEREVAEGDLFVQTLTAVGETEVLRDGETEEDAAPLGNVRDAETGSGARWDR